MDRSQPQEPLPREAASCQVVAGDLPSAPPGFQARAVLLAELDRATALVPVIHFVTGGPGVGKTMVAAAYARAKLAAGWRLVAWVNAGDTWSLLAGLARAAEAAGLNESDAGPGISDPGQLVRRRLEADGDRCLLVFDDARDPDLLQPFVPAYGAARVLITSPWRSSAIQGTSVPIDVFSGDEAKAFLTERTGRVDAEGAAALAAELGRVPLALAQAASVITGQSLSYGVYLERLRAVPVEEALSQEVGLPSVPGATQAVLLSLEAVRAADQTGTCTRVIEFLSVLSAAGVRRDLLHAAGQAGAFATGGHRLAAALVDEVLTRLAERSLVTVSLDGQIIIMHRIVMLLVRAEMARRQRLTAVCRLAASVLDARARAASQDRLAVRDVPEQVSALVDNAAGLVGEDKEFATALLGLLAAAYQDAGRDTMENPSAEAVPPAPEVPADREIPQSEEVSQDEEEPPAQEVPQNVLQEEEEVPEGEAVPFAAEVSADEEALQGEGIPQDAEVPTAQEVSQDAEVRQDEEVQQHAEEPSAVTAPGPPPEAPGDPEPEASGPERWATSDAPVGDHHDRTRRRRVLGLAAVILILLGAAAGGVTLVLTQGHAPVRPAGHAAAPVPRPAQMAAAWVAQQVSRSTIVACDPEMCAALEARGMPAANLLPIQSSTTSLLDAQVVVATPVVRGQFGGRLDSVYAPSVMASFGSGPGRVDVQVIAPQGAAAYLTALRQDMAARQAAGAQLLANKQITVAAQARPQLEAGEIDSRLLILLAALAAVHPIQILAFGDPGPGASPRVPWCSADLSGSGRAAGMADASYVSWLTAYVRAQLLPFAGSIITLTRDGQLVVRIEFSRPSPLGLLSRGAI